MKNQIPVVGLVMKSLQAEFFQNMKKAAVEYADKRGDLELKAVGTESQTEIEKQIQLVEELIDQGVNALVVIPIDSKALVAPVVKAVRADIEVINIDIMLDKKLLNMHHIELVFVGPDNEMAAKTVADVLARELGKRGKVIILEGVPGAINAQQRKQGFIKSIEEFGLNLLASETANWETEQAEAIFSELWQKYPDVEGVMCSNDAMAIGVINVLEAAGKTRKIKVIGFDHDKSARPLIKEGKLLATIDCFGSQMAVLGIDYAMRALSGENHKGWIKTKMELITGTK